MKNPFNIPAWLISGILCGLAHPLWLDVPTGFLMWFAFVPLLLDVRQPLIFKQYIFKTYPFVLVQVCFSGVFVAYSGFEKFVITNLSQTLLVMFAFLIHWVFLKRFGWRRSLWALPFIWTAAEWLKHITPHDFQVSPIANSQISVLWFAQIADVFGLWGVSFWLILVNVSIALTIENSPRVGNPWRVWASIFLKKWIFQAVFLFGLPLIYAFWSYLNLPNGQTVKVSLVQTNEDSYAKVDTALFNKRIETVLRLANDAAKAQPDLIVLPESAIPVPILKDSLAFKTLRYYVDNWNAAVAIGFVDYPDTTNRKRLYNSAMVFTPQLAREWDKLGVPTSELKVYRKQNPLPVMEYMPYAEALGFKDILGINGAEILRGAEAHVFAFSNHFDKEIKTSATICWEQMFPETQAELTETGAQFLCQMNNDGWFGSSVGQTLLLNMNRMRAIENRRTVARVSNQGISTFIDPFGRLYGTLAAHTEAVGTEGVVLNAELTFFTKHKAWLPKLCCLVLVGLYAFWYKKRNY